MTREEIREKYAALMREVAEGNGSTEEFRKLSNVCSHPYGEFNYDIGCWICPDCGYRKN